MNEEMIDIEAVVAEMTPLGQAEFHAAVARFRVKRLTEENERLRAQLAAHTSANGRAPAPVAP